MKTKIILTVETPDTNNLQIIEDCEKTEEDYTEEELKEYRENFAKDLHNLILNHIDELMKNEDAFFDMIEESDLGIEGWECMDDYGIKITMERMKNGTI
jgi:GTPase involved in cell partitioning and DNA repair